MSLSGRTILLTRDPAQSAAFIAEAERLGAYVLAFPTIRIAPPASWEEADRLLRNAPSYAAVAFPSANAVRAFAERCATLGMPADHLLTLPALAVGPRTARRAEEQGFSVAAVPEHFSAKDLVQHDAARSLAGKRVLLPQGSLARGDLAAGLAALGAIVDTAEVYRTLPSVPEEMEAVWDRLGRRTIDVVAFASPSAATAFADIYPASRLGPLSAAAAVAVIGGTTAQAVQDLGWNPVIIARESTMAGMLAAIITYFG